MTDIEAALRAAGFAHIWGCDCALVKDLADPRCLALQSALAAVVQGMVDVRERTIVDAGLVIAEQVREIEKLREVWEQWASYVDWLNKQNAGFAGLAAAHGFRHSPEIVVEGQRLREALGYDPKARAALRATPEAGE